MDQPEHRVAMAPGADDTAADQAAASTKTSQKYGTLPMPYVPSWDGSLPLTEPIETWPVPRHLLKHPGCLVIRVPKTDDSMHPALMGGDRILIDYRARVPRSRSFVLLRAGDRLLVRRCLRTGLEILYVPYNRDHDVIRPGPEVQVVGRVIAMVGRLFRRPPSEEKLAEEQQAAHPELGLG